MFSQSTFLELFGFLIYLLILFLFIIKVRDAKREKLYLFGFTVVLGLFISLFYGFSAEVAVRIIFGIILFNLVLSKELRHLRIPLVVLGLLYVLIFYQMGPVAISVALVLGIAGELMTGLEHEKKIEDKGIELRRDFIHLFGGIMLFALFFFVDYPLDGYIIQYVFLIGILIVFYAELWRNNRFSMSLYKIEKHKGYAGYGAIWLGIGTLVAYAFLDKSFFLLVLVSIYFADPIATFAGSYGRVFRLPYNRKKSLAGSAAYFATAAIFGYLLVGPISLVFALAGAAVESFPLKLDDNFSVSVALVILYYILFYAGII